MGKAILFSPVGGTDPISTSNFKDGSLLHICRVYKPDEVILYMSEEIYENHIRDNRYLYCLEMLAKKQHREVTYQIIERPELTDVQDFNYFYEEFLPILQKIHSEMGSDDILLYNISSGTPAMKSSLLVIQTLGEYPGHLIQVTTPDRKMNDNTHEGEYNVEDYWEANEDNVDDFENRCLEIECPSLMNIKRKEIIKKHISVYDYKAAFNVAKELPTDETKSYISLIKAGEYRLMLDGKMMDTALKNEKEWKIPIRTEPQRRCFEYALFLDIKQKKGEYADFLRAMTPLVVDLFELVLRNGYGIDINLYCSKGKIRKWNIFKLNNTPILTVFNNAYSSGFRQGPVSSDHLKILIEAYSNDGTLINLVKRLREVEENVRNLAAHEIMAITDKRIKNLTGSTSLEIMNDIKRIFAYTGINVKKAYWDSYNEMNSLIVKRMK